MQIIAKYLFTLLLASLLPLFPEIADDKPAFYANVEITYPYLENCEINFTEYSATQRLSGSIMPGNKDIIHQCPVLIT